MFDLSHKRVVVMPDLYVDALAQVGPWDEVRAAMDAVATRGGGNVPVGPVELRVGGNAANLGLALARLGAHVDLVAETDPFGLDLVRRAAHGTSMSLDRVRQGAPSATVGLECDGANVMLSHAGPVARFGPERLDDEDLRRIEEADAVAVVNWAQNKAGTALLEAVADHAQGFLYVDTGDPRHRGDLRPLVDSPAWRNVDAWGMNENELRAFCEAAGCSGADLLEAARHLSAHASVRVDLHTRRLAASVEAGDLVSVEADPAPGRRRTGAGDAWNAGNLAGYLLGWDSADRLRLAHEVASRYVCSEDGVHPRPAELVHST